MATVRDPRAECANETKHELLIRQLIGSDARMARNGFWKALRDLLDELKLRPEEFPSREFLPDAYLIDREAKEVRLYEVEVTCPLSSLKLADYGWLWFCFDCEEHLEWEPRLFVVDRYGHQNEIAMGQLYLNNVLAKYAPAA
jgi:hypothetical protein